MKKAGIIFFLTGVCLITRAQVAFKTIVKGPVVAGESFSVQYVLKNTDGNNNEFYSPDFKNFRLVSGPDFHEGTDNGSGVPSKVTNIVFSLEALKPGIFIIPAARVRTSDGYIKSDDVTLEVISRDEALKRAQALQDKETNTAYFLRPGEDPFRKMRDNLFLKVMVDKRSCFVGEAVTATFKLYSRLISRSDIIKNPGFYGFTVLDVVGLDDKQTDAEIIDGKKYDVHTVRKVQLYPLRSGSFTIDPMEITNQVEFSTSSVYKRKEQEIIEGVVPRNNIRESMNTESYENSMSSEPVKITVKAFPEKNRPADYSGATGHFSINASVNRYEVAKNEEGRLTVIITGKGNFTQLGAPVIHWPDSLEGFEPQVTDSLDKNYSPLKGKRVFEYSFVSAKTGDYIIPAITFSYFDPDSAHYKTISTRPVTITVINREKNDVKMAAGNDQTLQGNHFMPWLIALILLAGAAGWFILSKRKAKLAEDEKLAEEAKALPSIASLMKPAQVAMEKEGSFFYAACQQCAWNFFAAYFGLSGSKMNSRNLEIIMVRKRVDEKSRNEIISLLQECETGVFAGAVIETDKKGLVEKMTKSLEEISRFA